MTRLTLPLTTKVTLEEGLVGATVGFVEAVLAEVVDAFDVVVWPLGGAVDG